MAQAVTFYDYGDLTVHIHHGHQTVTSIWRDGTRLTATPMDTPECRARAEHLGYHGPDALWHMTRDHDLTHHLVARARGQRWSEHLHLVAQGKPSPDGADEEALVLLVQRASCQSIEAIATSEPELACSS